MRGRLVAGRLCTADYAPGLLGARGEKFLSKKMFFYNVFEIFQIKAFFKKKTFFKQKSFILIKMLISSKLFI